VLLQGRGDEHDEGARGAADGPTGSRDSEELASVQKFDLAHEAEDLFEIGASIEVEDVVAREPVHIAVIPVFLSPDSI